MTARNKRGNQDRLREKNRTDNVRFFSVTGIPSSFFSFLCSSVVLPFFIRTIGATAIPLAVAVMISGCLPQRCPTPTALGNLGDRVNSQWNDYAPVLPDTATLIFTSDRVLRGQTGLQGSYSQHRTANLMLTMRLTTTWDEAQRYEILFGEQKDAEIATISFPPVPNSLNALAYVVSCEEGCDIMAVSSGEAEALTSLGPGMNSAGWDGFPFVTADGSRLYFASDRSGGYGGTDIWYAEREANGLWGSPINAGPKVNSARDEFSPFVDSVSRKLYFAASTTDNGLDIFVLEQGASGRVPLLSPYNSPANDFTPFLRDGKLYLASNREGGCGGYDLYAFPIAE